jgi:hypothetical protein
LPGADNIDFKQTRQADREPFSYWRFRCAIEIAGITCPFEQLATGGHLIELVFADKKILPAVNLAGPRRSRRHGDGKPNFRVAPPDCFDHRAFADRRRS